MVVKRGNCVLDEWLPLLPIEENIAEAYLDRPGQGEKSSNVNCDNLLTQEMLNYINVIDLVVKSEKHNFQGEHISINKSWNIELLHSLLSEYHDKQVVDMLNFGFPVSRNDEVPLEMGGRNHKGATMFEADIDKYIANEIKCGATLGPFEKIPFKGEVALSPLSSRPKRDSNKRRIILDCSWPIGCSLNDGISKDYYLGEPVTLKYPTVDSLA